MTLTTGDGHAPRMSTPGVEERKCKGNDNEGKAEGTPRDSAGKRAETARVEAEERWTGGMTAQELIDYIEVNGYENFELLIKVDGAWTPVVDAWGIGGTIKISANAEDE